MCSIATKNYILDAVFFGIVPIENFSLKNYSSLLYSLTKWLAVSLTSCAGFWSLKATSSTQNPCASLYSITEINSVIEYDWRLAAISELPMFYVIEFIQSSGR